MKEKAAVRILVAMDGTRKRKRQFCGHCDDVVSYTLFYLHKKAFFRNRAWMKDIANALQFSANVFCMQPGDKEQEQQHPEKDVFKISDRTVFALLQCRRRFIWFMGHILCRLEGSSRLYIHSGNRLTSAWTAFVSM